MRSKVIVAMLSSCALACSLGLFGCVFDDDDDMVDQGIIEIEVPEQKEAESTDTVRVLGQNVDFALEVPVTNGLGANITSMRLRTSGSVYYDEDLLADEDPIAANEKVNVRFVHARKSDTYDILVRLEGSEEDLEFDLVPLADIKEATLKNEDGVAYVAYTTTSGEQVDTRAAMETHAAEVEEAQAARAAEEAQQANANVVPTYIPPTTEQTVEPEPEQPADEGVPASETEAETATETTPEVPEGTEETTPVTDQPVAEDPTSDIPITTPEAPAQEEDLCVEDVITREV